MRSLYQWLIEEKNYEEWVAEETVLRFENGFAIPEEVKKDINEYWNSEK